MEGEVCDNVVEHPSAIDELHTPMGLMLWDGCFIRRYDKISYLSKTQKMSH